MNEEELIDNPNESSGFDHSDAKINDTKKQKNKMAEVAFLAFAMCVFLLLGYYWLLGGKGDEQESQEPTASSNNLVTRTSAMNLEDYLPQEPEPEPEPVVVQNLPAVQPIVIEAPKEEENLIMERKRQRGMMIINNESEVVAGLSNNQSSSSFFEGEVIEEERTVSVLEEKYTPTVVSKTSATIVNRPEFTISRGTVIPCTLETEIRSDQAGMVTCIVNNDVKSLTGDFVMLERGTKIIGEYQTGIERGQARLFVLWTQARSPAPNYVVVDLNSPAAGALGAAGIGGYVDHKFFDRFGAALMLSTINIGMEIAASEYVSKNNNGADLSDANDYSEALAASVLEKTINIPPTLNVRQGTNVNVIVARDIDFSTVYQLKKK